MRKIFLLISLILLAIACRDESVIRVPDFQNAPNFRLVLEPDNSFFNISNLNDAKLVFNIYSENFNEIESVEIIAVFRSATAPPCDQLGCIGPVTVRTYLNDDLASIMEGEELTALGVIAALGMDPSEVAGGDTFTFTNRITMKDGRVYPSTNPVTGLDNVPAIFDQPGASYTASFNALVGCPYNIEELVGVYDKVVDSWEVSLSDHLEVEVETGPGANQFTVKNIFGFGFDLEVDVNPVSGALTVAKQETWDPQFWGFPDAYGKGYASAASTSGSTVFTCIGTINFKFTYSVDAGTFGGTHTYTLQKQ